MTALRWTVLACALTCLCLASVGSNAVLVHIDGILALNGSRATAPFSYAAGSAGSQSGGDASEGAAYAVPSSHDTSSLVFKFEDAVGSTGLTPKATAYDDVCAPKVKLRAVTQDKTSFEFIVNYNCMYKGSCFLNVMAGRPDREVIDVRWLKECAEGPVPDFSVTCADLKLGGATTAVVNGRVMGGWQPLAQEEDKLIVPAAADKTSFIIDLSSNSSSFRIPTSTSQDRSVLEVKPRVIQPPLQPGLYGVGKWTLAIFYRCKRNGRVAINVAVEVVDDGETEGSRIVTWSFLKECDLGPIGALSIHLGGFNGRGDGEVVREGKVVDAWAQPGSAVVGAHNALVTFIFRVDPDVMPGTDVGFESPKIKLLESGNSVVSVSLGGDGAGGKGSILGSGEDGTHVTVFHECKTTGKAKVQITVKATASEAGSGGEHVLGTQDLSFAYTKVCEAGAVPGLDLTFGVWSRVESRPPPVKDGTPSAGYERSQHAMRVRDTEPFTDLYLSVTRKGRTAYYSKPRVEVSRSGQTADEAAVILQPTVALLQFGMDVNATDAQIFSMQSARRFIPPPYVGEGGHYHPASDTPEDAFFEENGVDTHVVIRVVYNCQRNGMAIVTLILPAGESPTLHPVVVSWVKTCLVPPMTKLYVGTDKFGAKAALQSGTAPPTNGYGADVIRDGVVTAAYSASSHVHIVGKKTTEVTFFIYSLLNATTVQDGAHFFDTPIVRVSNDACKVALSGAATKGGLLCRSDESCGLYDLTLSFSCSTRGSSLVTVSIPVLEEEGSSHRRYPLSFTLTKSCGRTATFQKPSSGSIAAIKTAVLSFLALSAVAIVTVLVLWKPTALRRMWHALTNNSDGDVAGVLQAGGRRDTRRSSSGRSPNRSSVLPQQQHRYVRVSNGRRL